ncbi:MAG: pitrilysin family protein [Candidatus Omnitrophota bacterium]
MRRYVACALIAAAAAVVCAAHPASATEDRTYRRVLSNGIIAVVQESHRSALTAVELRVKTGSSSEFQFLGSGISHFVEHMLFKGTSRRPHPGDIEQEIKKLGGYINAFTGQDTTGYHAIVPSEHTAAVLEIVQDIISGPLFDAAELEKERAVILKEIKLHRDEPSQYLGQLLWSTMFRVHSYHYPVIGYDSLFKKLTRDDLLRYYKLAYVPDNIVIAVAGDVNGPKTLEEITRLFGSLERVSPPGITAPQEPAQIVPMEREEEREVSQTYIALGFRGIQLGNQDLFALDVLAAILGQGEDSRLYRTLYREKRCVYSIDAFDETPKDPGVFAITAICPPPQTEEAIAAVWQEIDAIAANPITEAELTRVKNQVSSSYAFGKQTVQDIASDLTNSEIMIGDSGFSRKYLDGISAVTREQVLAVARKYLRRESATLVRLEPKKEPLPPSAGHVASASHPLSFTTETLENGLRLILLEDHSLPIFSLNAFGLGGVRSESASTSGISALVANTLTCGTPTRTENEVSSQIEGCGASLDLFSGNNSFGLTSSSLSSESTRLIDIASDILVNPLFPADKVDREKKKAMASIDAIRDDIYQTGIRTLKHLLYRRHPYRFSNAGSRSSIERLTREDLAAYYRSYYTPASMVLAVAGDIDKKAVIGRLNEKLKNFKKSAAPPIVVQPEKARIRSREVSRPINKEQSLCLLGYLGTSIYNHDQYVLEVLASVMSGMNGRLSESIRKERGLAYTLDTRSIPGLEKGIIIFYIGTTRDKLTTAREELFKQIDLLTAHGITGDELRSASAELIGERRMHLQKVQDLAAQAALGSLYGIGYDDFLKYDDRIRHITKECVLRAARKYLRPNAYVLVSIKGTK